MGEKAENRDKRLCMRVYVCVCMRAKRGCIWRHFREISIWNSHDYRYASCFSPAITAGFPFLFVFTGGRPSLPLVAFRCSRVTSRHPGDRKGVSRRRALFIFYDILFPIRTRGHHVASRTLFDFYGVKSWWSVSRMDQPFPQFSLPFSSLSLSFLFPPIRTCQGFASKVKSENHSWYSWIFDILYCLLFWKRDVCQAQYLFFSYIISIHILFHYVSFFLY